MNTETANPFIVQKEDIAGLKFPVQDVLILANEKNQRKSFVERALLLGNNYKHKVKINFEDSESVKQVETTIWGLTDRHVILKGGINIPLHRIFIANAGSPQFL
jgi:hypothetical protein